MRRLSPEEKATRLLRLAGSKTVAASKAGVSMRLQSLWLSNPAEIQALAVEQVVAIAGDGNLRDDSVCSRELRAYLAEAGSTKLGEYVDRCLSARVPNGGLILQDLVNELGRRLDYAVTNGRYQGKTNAIGFDGLWIAPEGHSIVVEVKTTDAYRISLDTIARYREQLRTEARIIGSASVLIVVGREDTGELEAQVRGSQHAWDMRLISTDALMKLVLLKEEADGPETARKIRSLLSPMEYTRLDKMIDVMFTTARDVEEGSQPVPVPGGPAKTDKQKSGWQFTDAKVLQARRESIIAALGKREGANLIKRSRALYWNASHTVRAACTLSKRYERKNADYWYAFHPEWDEFLAGGERRFAVFACMDRRVAFAIPLEILRASLKALNTSDRDDGRHYWHVVLTETDSGDVVLVLAKTKSVLSLKPYELPFAS